MWEIGSDYKEDEAMEMIEWGGFVVIFRGK